MRPDKPSFTAAVVAFGRGVGLGGRRDDVARALLPAPFAVALDALGRAPLPRAITEGAARVGTLGLVDHASLRMAAVDDAVACAVKPDVGRPLDQVVLLGAGLDSRAWRMHELAAATVFEIDHPATQAYKRGRVDALELRAHDVRFVPVDFARESIGGALPGLGHDPESATLWLWEAVTMYLTLDAIEATLAEVAARSAPGSVLLVTYATRTAMDVPVVSPVIRAAFRVFGEPLIGAMHPDEAHAMLGRTGFEVTSDTGSTDWSERWGGSPRLARPFSSERLVVARLRTGAR